MGTRGRIQFAGVAHVFLGLYATLCLATTDRDLLIPGEDATSVTRTLKAPLRSEGSPGAGKRVAVTPPEWAHTEVHHMLYLPGDWHPDWKERNRSWPVIVEYTGNAFPRSGSTGRVEDANLGYGISGGRFIWVVLPFISEDRSRNALTWWGCETDTIEYARQNVPRICDVYGGQSDAVFLCGFSRGAIGVNYIGLHRDDIARLWCAFITHDHFDGLQEWPGTSWGSPLDVYRRRAAKRLQRCSNRPYLVCQQGGTQAIETYLQSLVDLGDFTFVGVDTKRILGPFPNETAIHPHTDRWLNRDSPERRRVWAWIDERLRSQASESPP